MIDTHANPSPQSRTAILDRVRTIMRRDLKLGSDIVIDETMLFAGGDADIDSLDILLLISSVEKEFGIKINSPEMGRRAFASVGALVDFLVDFLAGQSAGAPPPAPPAAPTADGDLLQQLPHQPPFRFVSRLTAVEPGQAAQGIWTVSGQEDFFAGHFPGRPIVPGVLIAEALAQLSGFAGNAAPSQARPQAHLAQVDVRFESSVIPPAEIQLRSRITQTAGSLIQYDVQAVCGAKIVARGTITLNWSPSPAAGEP